jgi:hypothetical protein
MKEIMQKGKKLFWLNLYRRSGMRREERRDETIRGRSHPSLLQLGKENRASD